MLEITNGLQHLVHRGVAKDLVAGIARRWPNLRLLYFQVLSNKFYFKYHFNLTRKKETYHKNYE